MLYYQITTNYSWNVFTVVCPLLQITTKMLTLYTNTFEIVHSGIYKITKIVHTLWLAERRVCMKVCKHGWDVKIFVFRGDIFAFQGYSDIPGCQISLTF